jgi:hypothetical protein
MGTLGQSTVGITWNIISPQITADSDFHISTVQCLFLLSKEHNFQYLGKGQPYFPEDSTAQSTQNGFMKTANSHPEPAYFHTSACTDNHVISGSD